MCDIGAVEVDARKPAFDAEPMPPGPLNFGSVQINHTITTSFTVHNAGNYSLTLSGPALGDAHFGIVSPTFSIGLAANQVKPIVLSCTPTVVGSLATTFTFNTTDADKPNVSYSLLCNGTAAPAPAFSSLPVPPGPIEFGEITIGQIVTQTITIKNNGTADLVLSNFHLPESQDFGTDIAAPSYTIGPGLSKQ